MDANRNDFKQIIEDYHNTEIPKELEYLVKRTIIQKERHMKKQKKLKYTGAAAAAAVILFVGTVNVNPAAAQAMYRIPVIKGLVELVTVRDLTYQDETHSAEVKVPEVTGLGNSELEASLNKKYLEENTKLYKDFMDTIDNDVSPANLALYTNYQIKVQTEDLLVIQGIRTEIAASGSESVQFDNIDLMNRIMITLPSLFQNDSYIDLISDNIKTQMRQKMKAEEGVMYFIEGDEDSVSGFDKIKPDQNFYIREDGKLVISFDEYEVAPGSMGLVEFVIPTDVIKDILVGNAYIK